MKNKLLFFSLVLLMFIAHISTAQQLVFNHISNGGFESKCDNCVWPDNPAMSDQLKDWESRTSEEVYFNQQLYPNDFYFMHSPDWKLSNINFNNAHPPGFILPRSGFGLLGMYKYELIQQQFQDDKRLEKNKFYELSLNVGLSNLNVDWSNTKLSVYLSTGKFRYDNEGTIIWQNQQYSDFCTEAYKTAKPSILNSFQNIADFTINPQEFIEGNAVQSKYLKFKKTFSTPATGIGNYSNYNWIIIQLEDIIPFYDQGNADCDKDQYIYLDDIAVISADKCESECRPNLGPISFEDFGNAVIVSQAPFNGKIANATHYVFEVFSTFNGNMEYRQEGYDFNGLNDPGYPNHFFSWVGLKANGNPLVEDAYAYRLDAWNCDYSATKIGSIQYLLGNINYNQQAPIPKNLEPECCKDIRLIQNKTYFENIEEKADVYIRAGRQVDPNNTIGNVTALSQFYPQIKYYAPVVSLENGFNISAANADFEARPANGCFNIDYARMGSFRNYGTPLELIECNTCDEIIIYPNPVSSEHDFLNIKSEQKSMENICKMPDISEISIYNLSGSILYEINVKNQEMVDIQIPIQNMNNGLYFIVIKLNDGNLCYKKVIIN
ncbi:MAG: T9SS type A sorting domain-containing protein [Flavobacteriales bacterium]